ncbi:MAG: fumarylacetoacetate hydrolase family protein, partial [Nitrososphaera sp.]
MRVARILTANNMQTFALVNPQGNLIITKDEIEKQLGIGLPSSVEDFLFEGYAEKIKNKMNKLSFKHDIQQFRLLAPITRSFKIICLAFNYTDQASWVRFGKDPPKEPVIYMKSRTTLVGPFDDIVCPRFVTQLDYEGELAFTIGKRCRKINEADAINYIAGYFVLNDVSARDVQFIDKQYT